MPNPTKAELLAENRKLARRIATLERAKKKGVADPADAKKLRAELLDAAQREAATAEIFKVIASSPSDVQPVFHTIAESSMRLVGGLSGVVTRVAGDDLQLVAFTQTGTAGDNVLKAIRSLPLSDLTDIHCRVVKGAVPEYYADTETDAKITAEGRAMAQARGFRSVLSVPMIRGGVAIGTIGVTRDQPGEFRPQQIALLKTFADQAVIAIENVRLFNETKEALERQTATAEILKVIASSPSDVQPVFDAIASSSNRLLGGLSTVVARVFGDALHLVGLTTTNESADELLKSTFPMPLTGKSAPVKVVRTATTVCIEDLETDIDVTPAMREVARARGWQSALMVPLKRENAAIGIISVTRREAGKFSSYQVELLETFADQAVIAIENVRLFNETREGLERQTATAEILKVIASSPSDVQPVFDVIAESAVRLFNGQTASVTRLDGDMLQLAAMTSNSEEGNASVLNSYPRALSSESLNSTVVRSGKPGFWSDIQNDPTASADLKARAIARGWRSNLVVPMLREGRAIGSISITRAEAGTFTPHQVNLLQTFADQAVIAIENVRLFNETKESLERQTATADILKVIASSPSDVQPVFEAIAESAKQLFGGYSSSVWRVAGNALHLTAYTATEAAGNEAMKKRPPVPLSQTDALIARAAASAKPLIDSDIENNLLTSPSGKELARVRGYRSRLAVPMVREGAVLGVISMTRREAGSFSDHQVNLLSTFADQAVIAIENVRLFNETKESLERQTATAEILKVIASSPSDVQPVFDAIAENSNRLIGGHSTTVLRVEDDMLKLVAYTSTGEEGDAALRSHFPVPVARARGFSRVVQEKVAVKLLDSETDPDILPESREMARARGWRSRIMVPLVRDDASAGVISVTRREPGDFSDKHVELLQTFADQAVIAIENVRLFNETKEALEQQTATAEILKVIASSPSDVQPVFDAIVSAALRLVGGHTGHVTRLEGDSLRLAAFSNTTAQGAEALHRLYPMRIAGTDYGDILASGNVRMIADSETDPQMADGARAAMRARGVRGSISVPMMRGGALIGTIMVNRRQAGAFSEREVGILTTFADQAVIAIENVRLFKETQESLERQTATADILKVIASSPADVQPVFDAIAQSAKKVFGGHSTSVWRVAGEMLQITAYTATEGAGDEAMSDRPPIARSRTNAIVARAAASLKPVIVTDVETDPLGTPFAKELARARGYRSMLAVPMVREGFVLGVINVTRREAGSFSDHQVDLLCTFADQAVIAIENVRMFNETNEALAALSKSVGQLTALGEVGQAISSTLDLETVLKTIVSHAIQLTGLDGGSMYEYDEAAKVFRMQTSENMAEELMQVTRNAPIRLGDGAVGGTGVTREPIQVPDTLDDSYRSDRKELLIRSGYRAVLAVPLLREDNLLGALLVTRKTPGEFPPETVALLQTFATQSAMAIQNARLFREIAEKGKQLEIASHHKSDFLASMSHELRTPLNAILGFNELILAEIYGAVPEEMKEPLSDIQTSGKHLLRLINNVLDLAKIEAGRMELALADYSVHDTVESVRSTLRPLAAEKGLDFVTTVPEDIPIAYGDFGRITQCLMNLAGNSLKFTKAGKVEIAVQLKEGVLVYRVNDTGIGIPPDKIASLFTEFKQTDATIASEYGGTGLGLSISKKFIEMHGGRIWIESELGKGSSFIFEVPLRVDASRGAGA